MLTIPISELKRLCAIESADTSQDAALTALLAAEQPVWEWAIDPAALSAASTDTGLLATLTLGITEALAGRYLQQMARTPGMTDDFKIGELSVTASKTNDLNIQGVALIGAGDDRLAPFRRASHTIPALALPDAQTGTPLLLFVPGQSNKGGSR